MIINDIAHCQRPYEKAMEYGVSVLSDAELIATIIRSGTTDTSSVELAHRVLNTHYLYKGLEGLNYMNRDDLLNIKGIGNTKATQILAVAELSSRMNRQRLKKVIRFNNPKSIADYYQEKCRYLRKERLYMMAFDNSNALIKEVLLSEGTINQALISPREIFIEAFRCEAVNFVLVHNHPSGITEPSNEDINETLLLYKLGMYMRINLLDHIIVGQNSYTSMKDKGII